MDWKPASSAPQGEPVMTKVDDGFGSRQHSALVRRGRLWWTVDGAMYVYYTPTHYRQMTQEETQAERDRLAVLARSKEAEAARIRSIF